MPRNRVALYAREAHHYSSWELVRGLFIGIRPDFRRIPTEVCVRKPLGFVLMASMVLLVGQDDCSTDADGDGWSTTDGDCNDADATIHPGATEVCDGVDNNCDRAIDDVDEDGDGYIAEECGGDDCDDTNANLNESCDIPPPDSDLVGYWDFEDTDGTVTDLSGYENHGSWYGSVNVVEGKVGVGYQMSDGACVTVPYSESLSQTGGSGITYMAWVYYTSPCTSDRGMILNQENLYEVGINCGTGDYIQEAVESDTTTWFWTGSTSITRDTWQHVAVTWDGSVVQRYLDGVAIEDPRALTGAFPDHNYGLGIGCRGVDADGLAPSGSYFNGVIDEVAVYGRALGADELAAYVANTQ